MLTLYKKIKLNALIAASIICAAGISTQALALGKHDIELKAAVMDGLHVIGNGVTIGAGGFQSDQLLYILPDGRTFDYLQGNFDGPIDVTQTPDGALYVTNFNNASVSKVMPDGTVSKFADVLEGPAGITSDQEGNLYVSHFGAVGGGGNTVVKISPEGVVSTYATGGMLKEPIGITFDDDGMLYVANFNDGIIMQIDENGVQTQIAQIESDIGFAVGHLTFANNNLYASNPAGSKAYKLRIKNGRIGHLRALNASKNLTYPNGVTYNPFTNSVMFAEAQQTGTLVSVNAGATRSRDED